MKALEGGFVLNGCDAFMLAMDQAMVRRSSGYHQGIPPLSAGNICHLLITFSPGADTHTIAQKIVRSSLYQNLANLRLSIRVMRAPLWYKLPATRLPPHPHERDTSAHVDEGIASPHKLEEWILHHAINPKVEAPFGFLHLPSYSLGPSLLFFWHHALTDARGGELLVKLLSQEKRGEEVVDLPTPQNTWQRSMKDSLRVAHRTKKVIFAKSAPSIVRISGVTSHYRTPLPSYRFLEFSKEESKKIDQLSLNVCNGIFPMAMYLAATTRAAAPLFSSTSNTSEKIFIPVPHDMRRFTKEKSPLSNQISFLFFSVDRNSARTLKEETSLIIEQLHDSIFLEHHWGMLSFLRLLRWLPSSLLWRTIEQPTKGHPASLYFSDIGSTLSQLSQFMGVEVLNAAHYPPVVIPPGLTTVWSRFRDALKVTICFDQSVLSTDAVDQFIARLKKELSSAV